MKQLKVHVAVSLDGFIAKNDGNSDWIPSDVKQSITGEIKAAEILFAGSNTYKNIFEHWGGWPYKSQKTFVIAHRDTNFSQKDNVEFLTDSPMEFVQNIKMNALGNFAVIGGNGLVASLINSSLLDELIIYTIPVMLGEGIPFLGKTISSEWELLASYVQNNVICTTYRFAR